MSLSVHFFSVLQQTDGLFYLPLIHYKCPSTFKSSHHSSHLVSLAPSLYWSKEFLLRGSLIEMAKASSGSLQHLRTCLVFTVFVGFVLIPSEAAVKQYSLFKKCKCLFFRVTYQYYLLLSPEAHSQVLNNFKKMVSLLIASFDEMMTWNFNPPSQKFYVIDVDQKSRTMRLVIAVALTR